MKTKCTRDCTSQWWISEFPREGALIPRWGRQPNILASFPYVARTLGTPLEPPLLQTGSAADRNWADVRYINKDGINGIEFVGYFYRDTAEAMVPTVD